MPKLKIPPEFCYYAFNDKEPEQIPRLWKITQQDRARFQNNDDVAMGLKSLIQNIESRLIGKEEVLDQMHHVFSSALMQGYEKMEDLVENTGSSDRVNEIRNILIPFLPKKMHPFIPDHHRDFIHPSRRHQVSRTMP